MLKQLRRLCWLRQREQDAASQVFAQAQGRLQHLLNRKQAMALRQSEIREAIQECLIERASLAAVQALDEEQTLLVQRESALSVWIEEAQHKVDETRQAYVQAHQRRRVADRLLERRLKEHRKQMQARQQRQTEDMAIARQTAGYGAVR